MTRVLMLLLCGAVLLSGQSRRVAITIDDLPIGGDLGNPCDPDRVLRVSRTLLEPLRDQRIPVIGFLNEGRCPDLGRDALRQVLNLWTNAGAELGNHTYSHMDLNRVSIGEFERDVIRGEALLEAPRYFRHPFLHVGLELSKRREIERFLRNRGYRIAPVTLDNSDYMFAAVYAHALTAGQHDLAERARTAYLPYMESVVAWFEKRSVEVTGREIAQILLMHVNELNARSMPALIAMFRKRGYQFVSLGEALKDPAYDLPDDYAGPGGFSWIHHWSITKGMPKKGEPDEPAWLLEAYRATRAE
jgi:peptidoglycan/xylan/chitin deacetylase (PgdA/CDA1 family)